jgi:GNAT superfamily N-acetyltransferase
LQDAQPPFVQLENAEADSWAEIQTCASAEFRARFDVGVDHVDGAVVITAPKTNMPALNRAWLPGRMQAVTSDSLEPVLHHARTRGLTYLLVHCPPWATPDGFPIAGARPANPMVKLYRQADRSVEASSPLEIRAIGASDGELFGDIAAQGNEAPEFMADGFNSTVGQAGWKHYLAFDGAIPIAAAAVRFHGEVAWCCFAGTIPAYRGRGAQRALLARRVADAAAHGCTWVTCESLPDRPGMPSFSLANMLATGFTPAYERPSFVVET